MKKDVNPYNISNRSLKAFLRAGFYLPLLTVKQHLEHNLNCNISKKEKLQYQKLLNEVNAKLPLAKHRFYTLNEFN